MPTIITFCLPYEKLLVKLQRTYTIAILELSEYTEDEARY